MSNSSLVQDIKPSLPANESERLAALHRYQILDTPAEAAFDRITTLTARLFKMPTVLISLVDESRAWFKSSVGFDASEAPRDATICNFAVLSDKPLIVPDTQLDDRFACKPFVQCESGLRFYAGAPLISRDGFSLGTLCLEDSVPHPPLDTDQVATLVDLAAMVVDELELRLVAQQVAKVNAALVEITLGVERAAGGDFLDALVRYFAKVLGTDYVYIGLVEGTKPKMMRTIVTCDRGNIIENFEYRLQDTPCWEAVEQRKLCCYPRNVKNQFPNAPLLQSLPVESYIAIPFHSFDGSVMGLLGIMDGKPLIDVQLAESLLTIFSTRIAVELNRQQYEVALIERNQELDSFAHTVSHDLKAPLRAISNLSQWIEDDLEDQLLPDNLQQFQLLRTRVKRMESMINSLLLYARAGRQEAQLETLDLAELLSEVIDSIAPPEGFKIDIQPPLPTLTTKRVFLSQVLTNLISNAIKHHNSVTGHLHIWAIEHSDYHEFIIKDDGPGIAPEDHERVFAIFQTLADKDNTDSTGIGLAIVKKIIETEQGTIRLESSLGEGTTFYVTWPK